MANVEDVLPLIDSRRWGLRMSLVQLVLRESRSSFDGWAWISHRRAEHLLCCGHGYGNKLFRALVRERVLDVGLAGIGTRPTAYRVNGRVEVWRAVPWRETNRQLVLERLAEISRAPERGARRASAPRSHGAALEGPAPRSHGAALGESVPRQEIAALARGQRRDLERGANAGPSALDGNPTNVVIDQVSLERASRITEAIETRTGRPVYGSLAARVQRLAQRAELGPMLEAIACAPVEFQPPLLVQHLERVASGQPIDGGRPTPVPRLVELTRELDYLDFQISEAEAAEDRMRADGYPMPEVNVELDELRRRRAECQNALDQEVASA